MVVFPNCKINIGLNILGKRPDGYHNLQTIFYPINIKDALEIIEAKESVQPVLFSSSGITLEGNEEDNLCLKAVYLLKKDFPQLSSVQMHLHKNIPVGAGLGGGSADAAFTLKLLNNKFSLEFTQQQLIKYATVLGSDCPFFILNKPCYATGRGEILEEISIDFSAYKILLVNPGIHINTAWAFSQLAIKEKARKNLKELIKQPISTWQQTIVNDFEKPVFAAHPEIASIKNYLYQQGALFASMSGSGSSIFGIFEKNNHPTINFPAHYFCRFV